MARRSSTAASLREASPPSQPRLRTAADAALRAPDGAKVQLVDGALEVLDPAGRLLLRYRDGALEVSPVEGDLVLASATGQVRIAAATDVVVEASRDVRLAAQRGFEASAGAAAESRDATAEQTTAEQTTADPAARVRGSRLALDPRRAVMATPSLDVRARTTQLATADATVLAGRIRTTASRMATTVEELEVTAGHVVERARDVVQEVSDVLTSRIGRVRAVVRDVYSLRSKRTELKSKDDTAIDGRRVLLG